MANDPERVSVSTEDPIQSARQKFADMFPGVVRDGVLDVGVLSDLVGLPTSGPADTSERFGLMWAGRRRAVEALQASSMATLVPDPENSIGWDTAQNVFIEGDNLEVLKLLQKSYNDKVNLIYIDPPYNTGNDFVYNDDFSDSVRRYFEVTGQVDAEGNRLVANTDVSGRKHSNWLSMMYPRLMLARNLLTQDGMIFVSIDENEQAHLRIIMDEIFGPENHVATFIWRKKYSLSFTAENVISIHEYVLAYRRGRGTSLVDPWWTGRETVTVAPVFKSQNGQSTKTFRAGALLKGGGDAKIGPGEIKLPSQVLMFHDAAFFKDGRLISDVTVTGRFSVGQETLDNRATEVVFAQSGAAYIESSDDEKEKQISPLSILFDYTSGDLDELRESYDFRRSISTRQATEELAALGLKNFFSNPKPVQLIRALISYCTKPGDVVLDFFAGSGSTGHAVMAQNQLDGGKRRYILVNAAEETDLKSTARQAGVETISEITRLRLKKVAENVPGAADMGLRCFRLGPSNFVNATGVGDGGLPLLIEDTLVDGADDESIVAECLLKSGVRLDEPWVRDSYGDAPVVKAGSVGVVTAREATEAVCEAALADSETHTVVFLEDSFAERDGVKTNAHFAFKQANKTMRTI